MLASPRLCVESPGRQACFASHLLLLQRWCKLASAVLSVCPCYMCACLSSPDAGLWVSFLLSVPLHSSSSSCLVSISPALPLRVSFSPSISRQESCASALTLDLPSSPVNSVSLSVFLLPISHFCSPTNSLELYWHPRWVVLPSHYRLKLNEDAILKYAFSPFPSSFLLSKASISFHIIFICPFLCCVISNSFFFWLTSPFLSFLTCSLFSNPYFSSVYSSRSLDSSAL